MGLFISHINTSKSTWSRAGADAQWCLQNWLLLSPNDAQNVGFPLHAYCQMVAAPTSIISASRRGAKGQRGYEPLAFQKLSQEFPWPRLCLITPLATEDSGMVRYKLGAFLGQTNADSIGKGGQSVCAKESSSQLTGPPPPFHLFCLPFVSQFLKLILLFHLPSIFLSRRETWKWAWRGEAAECQ